MIPSECQLERFFTKWEFTVEHILGASDVEGYTLRELLDLASSDMHARWDGLTLGYTETAGLPELRSAIAGLYETATPEDIVVCGGGAVEALFLTINALLEPGSHAVVVWPAFESMYKVTRAVGAEVTLVPLRAADGWRLDLEAVRRALRPGTRAIIVNFPHNPTGMIPDLDTFRGLVEIARERGIALVSDEVYRLMEFDPRQRLPAAVDLDTRAISVGVMSKAYGLAGLRIGWVATRDPVLLRRIKAIKDYTTVCSAAPAEILALIALRAQHHVVHRCMKIVTQNLTDVDAFFDRWPGLFEWVRPQGGTVGFPLLKASLPVDQFAAELAEQEGVLILPGTVFDHPENRFRIGLGRCSLPAALERLDNYVSRRLA
jgi:aspartate/methionine/tyrosine aminotransferase